jgi:hypothetical protein
MNRSRARVVATFFVGVAIAALAGVAGCALTGGGVSPVNVPAETPGITGVIKSIARSNQDAVWGTMLVEGGKQPAGAASDKAMVSITDQTSIARGGRWIGPEDLAVGMTVRVWFFGAVAESYPVQGAARFVEVP